ncbi:protein kinase (macronuclear) [Tetrahymena thermophila SB210]|uniref:Protein kinase n=1 Tax=Tetrahymena thermophila (strain SB210) TaxID=312017 RepID=Q233B9_TETTS|nr:protein kinase [Tetrahymena thermophila SB210]EAR91661.3 protein kinase [Tetrahymena thermophila SB210]|eukprot:XP_001011906.3 protein kinase [Tetrahymena thermophila SB210]
MSSVLKQIASLKGIQFQSYKQNKKDQRVFFLNSQNEGHGYTVLVEDLGDIDDNVNNTTLNQLKQKITFLKDCDHLNILKHKEDFIIDDKFIILMEKCQYSLKTHIQRKYLYVQIHLQVFIDFALQLLNAVEYLHSKNLYLSNFSNENIFLDENFNIKLHDFGLRKSINTLQAYKLFQIGANQKGFHYFAPEQLNSSLETYVLQTAEADIWSVGISLYLLAGSNLDHIYLLTRGLQQYQKQMQINEEMNLLLSQMLSQDPNKRPQISHIKQQFEIIKKNVNFKQNFLNTGYKQEEVEKFIKAQVMYQNDLNKESLQLLEELVENNQNNDMYLAWKARNLARFDRYQESQELADKAVSINPKNYFAFNVKGYIYSMTNELQLAEECLKTTISLNPQFITAVQNICNNYEENGKISESLEMYEQSNLHNPNNMQILINLSRIYLNNLKYENSMKYLQQNIKMYPYNYYSLYYLGLICKATKFYNKSQLCYKKIIQNDLFTVEESLVSILSQLGSIQFDKKQFEKSLKSYKKCQRLEPDENAYVFNVSLMKKLI